MTFPAIRLEDDSDYSQIDANGGSLRLLADAGNASSNSNIQFQVDGTERLRIASDGQATFQIQVISCRFCFNSTRNANWTHSHTHPAAKKK